MHYPKSQSNVLNMDIQMSSRWFTKILLFRYFLAFISMPKDFDILFLIYEILM